MRTYVDSGVLIAAARGNGALATKALNVLQDTTREFVSSDYVKLEVVPKPTYLGRTEELRFYEEFFASAATWRAFDVADLEMALIEACKCGLQAMDAVHVVAAINCKCDELVTSEKPDRPIHRTDLITIVSIDA